MLDDLAAGTRERLLERVGDALPEGLGVVDDVDGLLAEGAVDVQRRGRALDVVGGDDADVVVRLGPDRLGRIALGQVRVRVGRRALGQARRVGDRDLGLGDARVERADHRHVGLVRDDLGHVVGAGLRIVRAGAGKGVIEDRRVGDRDRVPARGATGLLERKADALDDRIGRSLLTALERELDGDLDRRRCSAGCTAARTDGQHRCRTNDSQFRELHSVLSSSFAVGRVAPVDLGRCRLHRRPAAPAHASGARGYGPTVGRPEFGRGRVRASGGT